MARFTNYVPLQGSERTAPAGARLLGPVDPDQRVEVSVLLKARQPPDTAALAQTSPRDRRPLSRQEFTDAHGAHPDDLALVEEFAHEHGLTVVDASRPRRTVALAGTAAAMMQAFGTQLGRYVSQDGTPWRGRTGAVHVPEELERVVEAVLGLDDRAQAKPHFRRRTGSEPHASPGTFTPVEVAKAYEFPALDGSGECIALVELGGGYRAADLRAYFGTHAPVVGAVSVDGGHNAPTGDPSGPDGEVMLDIEVAGAIARGARIAVYFAPNTDRGFLDAVTTAIHDAVRKPSVVSISWGSPESSWTPQAMRAFDQALAGAALLGVTVCCASGDSGSSDGVDDHRPHVDFPASSPHALACGGTRLTVRGAEVTESVWDELATGGGASGGGFSAVFPPPSWQTGARAPAKQEGRGVPDVAGDADPQTGYRVRVDGVDTVIGGTSAVAPLWAALIALVNQQLRQEGLHPAGFIQPFLYRSPVSSAGLRDVTAGSNGAYKAGPGWDPCTGLGSPKGTALLDLLRGGGRA